LRITAIKNYAQAYTERKLAEIKINERHYYVQAVNAAFRADYFRMQEVLNVCISVQNQADILYQLFKRYLYSVLILLLSAFITRLNADWTNF